MTLSSVGLPLRPRRVTLPVVAAAIWRDDKAWRAHLRERLTPEQRRRLNEGWTRSAERRHALREGRAGRDLELFKRSWMHWALKLDVQLRPPALAVLRDPSDAPGSRVEVRWQWVTGVRPMGGANRSLEISEVRVVFGSPGFGEDPDLDHYRTALSVRFARGEIPDTFAPRPEHGRPVRTDFYKQLLAAYDELVAANNRAPAKELARIYDVDHERVKTWLRRGRKYVKGEQR